jgi:hypothetical protein
MSHFMIIGTVDDALQELVTYKLLRQRRPELSGGGSFRSFRYRIDFTNDALTFCTLLTLDAVPVYQSGSHSQSGA